MYRHASWALSTNCCAQCVQISDPWLLHEVLAVAGRRPDLIDKPRGFPLPVYDCFDRVSPHVGVGSGAHSTDSAAHLSSFGNLSLSASCFCLTGLHPGMRAVGACHRLFEYSAAWEVPVRRACQG